MKAVESPVVKLCGLNPPIEKMDGTLGQLVRCEKLSLSTNNIDKIANLTNLRSLKVRIRTMNTTFWESERYEVFPAVHYVHGPIDFFSVGLCYVCHQKEASICKKVYINRHRKPCSTAPDIPTISFPPTPVRCHLFNGSSLTYVHEFAH